MPKKDLLLSFIASLITAAFLVPTLINTDYYQKIPFIFAILFVVFPVATIIGTYIAYILGRKLAIFWQLAKFALVGVLNTAIDFGILNALIFTTGITSGIGIIPLNVASFSTAIVNSYFWNKKWVFGASKGSFVVFVVVTLIGLGINTGVVFALTTFVPPVFVTSETLWANLAKVLATALSLIWNFAGYRLIVFKASKTASVGVKT
jgi:putative flippase GtrA